MRATIPAMLLLQHRGINKRWNLWWLVTWTVAVLSSQVAIPRVGPAIAPPFSRSLEQLGAIGLCLPLVLVAILVTDRTEWLTGSSPRNARLVNLATAILINGIGLFSSMVAASLYPQDIRWIRIVSLFALLLAVTLITGSIIGRTWAAFPGPVFIVVNTVPGLIPWEWNIVYNPATDGALIAAAITSQVVAITASCIAIPRSSTS